MAGKKFAVFDIDGTLIRWQLYHAIADTTVKLGYVAPVTYQPVRDARMEWKRRQGGSFKDYEFQVINTYEKVLKSLSFEQFEAAIQAVFDEYKDQVYTYTRDLIAKLKQDGYLLFAISGSQTEIVAKIANYYGFDEFRGSVYEFKNGKFTGAKEVAAWHKDEVLMEIAGKSKAVFSGSIGVGDSFSDIKMLELVEQPVAFNPEQELFKYAKRKDWKIVVERKNMVYELEAKDGKYQLVKTSAR